MFRDYEDTVCAHFTIMVSLINKIDLLVDHTKFHLNFCKNSRHVASDRKSSTEILILPSYFNLGENISTHQCQNEEQWEEIVSGTNAGMDAYVYDMYNI